LAVNNAEIILLKIISIPFFLITNLKNKTMIETKMVQQLLNCRTIFA